MQQSDAESSFEFLPSDAGSLQLAREPNLSPYSHLGLDFESLFQERVSDACLRWDGMLHKQGVDMDDRDAALANQAEDMMKLQDMTRQRQEKNRTAVVECHRLMTDMTATLTEVLTSDTLEAEVHEHLKKAMQTFVSQLKEQHGELMKLENEQKQATAQAQITSAAAFGQAVHWVCVALCISALAVCLGTWSQEFSGAVLLSGFFGDSMKSVDAESGSTPLLPLSVQVVAPLLLLVCFGHCCWQAYMEGESRRCQAGMLQRSRGKATEARDMWQGIRDSAEELRAHVETLSGLGKDRVTRRKYEMREVAKGIIATWCAVGEYIVWRDQQGHFPATFSAQGLLGRQRYQQIYSAMFQPLPPGRRSPQKRVR